MESRKRRELEAQGVPAIEPEEVRIPTENPDSLKEVVPLSAQKDQELVAQLYMGEGEAKNRAAVLVIHGLSGVKPQRESTYARKLAAAGYVALTIDAFRSRGLETRNDDMKALMMTTWQLLADSFAGLRYLARHPAVNPRAISGIGFSWGGMAVVLAAYEQIRHAYMGASELAFAGHVSYYGCSIPRLEDPRTTGAPVVMLLGRRDRNVSLERSREIAEDLRRGGSDVRLEEFDAFHQWDGNDHEVRHVTFSLRDLALKVTKDNRLLPENGGFEVSGRIARLAHVIQEVSWDGYDIKRDEELHRATDRLLFQFLAERAEAAGALVGETSKICYGAIDDPERP